MNIIADICIYIEIFLILYQLWKTVSSDDVSRIWSPIIIISLVYIYYCIIPHFYSGNGAFSINEDAHNGYLFHIASLLSYVFILIGFTKTKGGSGFTKWNKIFNENNAKYYGLLLCGIGFVCYSIVHGFNFSMLATGEVHMSNSGFAYYLDNLIELFPIGLGLLICAWKKDKKLLWIFIVIWLCFVTLILRGSRGRMIMALIPMLIAWYNYPKAKKLNYVAVTTLAIVMYLFFAVMDSARTYYGGINIERASEISLSDASKGAGENYTVYQYTMMSIDKANTNGVHFYFEPIVTALFMPIPRYIFPWKPDASYLFQWESSIYGAATGNAFLNFAESFLSFGWIGIIFWAWLLGWLSRKFWDNFQNNRNRIGAFLLLGAFNGMCYIIISRGYLAQSVTSFIFSICLPFWIVISIKKINKTAK